MTHSTRYIAGAAAAAVLLSSGACTDADPTAIEEVGNAPPAIASFSVTKVGDVYLRVALKASVTDAEGDITNLIVDWGDGTSFTVVSGFAAVDIIHDYARADATYAITLVAADNGNNRTSRKESIRLDKAPGACLDIKLVGVCFQTHPDYKGADLTLKAFDNTVASASLSNSRNRVETFVPVAGIAAQAKVVLTANFSPAKGRSWVRARIYGCTLFTICTTQLADQTLPW
jgi:hypothetical protein